MDDRTTITLVGVGGIKTWFFPRFRRALSEALEREVSVLPAIPMPSSAWHPDRRQYAASDLLDALAAISAGGPRIVGVVAEDLFVPGWDYVFGDADHRRGVAVFSIRRLATGNELPAFLDLATAEAVRQTARAHGLERCGDRRCILSSPDGAYGRERSRRWFCGPHAAELRLADGVTGMRRIA